MGGGSGGEEPGRFAFQFTIQPETGRRIDELLHLRSHVAIAGWSTEDNPVCGPQVVERADRDSLLPLSHLPCKVIAVDDSLHLLKLPDPAEQNLDSIYRTDPFRYSLGHLQGVAVHRVIDD